MSFYKKIVFNKIKNKEITYTVSSDFIDKFCGDSLAVLNPNLVPLDIPGKYRSVWLSEELNVVVKHNQLKGARRRFFAHFGWQNILGKYSLSDEYYEGSLTADEMVLKYPERKYEIIEQVFELFLKAWNAGFAYMDPHPKNILFLNDKDLKFIDFECCCLSIEDKEFYFGFSMGYFFHFWFHKYFRVSEYSNYVYSFLDENLKDIDMMRFALFYEKFKSHSVSRKKRYKCFYSSSQRVKLIGRD